MGKGKSKIRAARKHSVDETVFERFLRAHEIVSIRIANELVIAAAGEAGHQFVHLTLDEQQLASTDFNIARLTFCAAQG